MIFFGKLINPDEAYIPSLAKNYEQEILSLWNAFRINQELCQHVNWN